MASRMKFRSCMKKELKGKLKGKPKTARIAKFKAAAKKCSRG